MGANRIQIRRSLEEIISKLTGSKPSMTEESEVVLLGGNPPDPLWLVLVGQHVANEFGVPAPAGSDSMGLDDSFPINPTVGDYIDWIEARRGTSN